MEPVVWVVLPTYNEAQNLPALLAALRESPPDDVGAVLRVLVVDDASPDGTGAIADALAARHEELHVLHRPLKQGLGAAYAAGFGEVLRRGADLIVQMDADFSHDPGDVGRLVATVRDGADVAIGSRYVPGGRIDNWSRPRRALSAFGSWYARRLLGVGVRDLTGGFKCFTAEALTRVDYQGARAHGYAFQVETSYRALRAGLRVVEIPIVFRERREGASKMTLPIALEAAWRVPLLRWSARR